MKDVKDEVWQAVQALNHAWTGSDVNEKELENYFHQDMVAITPTERERLEGREACIAGWTAFAKAAKIHYFRESDPKIQVYGDAAVVTYYWDMSYDIGGNTITLGGRDMFVLVRERGKWWVVADQFSPYPQG